MRTRRRSTLDTPAARPDADGASLGWPVALPPVVPPEALPPQPDLPRIKVLHVITRFWAGAGGNTLLSALGAAPDRYDVWVAGADGGPLWERAERAGLRTVKLRRFREVLSPFDDLSVLWQLVRLLRRERFTVVHTHSAKGGFLGRLAAWLTRVPLVVHTYHGFSYHDYMPAWRRRLYLTLERLVRRFTHAFLAVSPRVASEAVAMRLAPPGSVTVVPSAVELDQLPDRPDPRLRKELGLPAGTRLVGTVGRLDFQKAPLDFVRMAARVAAARPAVRFVMVGDGPMADEVRAEAERLGVEVALVGFRADAPVLATAFDVFVISSLYEGLGRALTEALGSGRPVVATAVNGVPDLVVPGSTGLLAPPGDPGALAESVTWLLDHPEEGRRMGGQGRVLVRTLFDPALMCELIDRTYRHLLGLPDPGGQEIELTDRPQARPVAAAAATADARAGLVAEKRGA
ncbi:MAG TPA: glycosyltransferase family 4 protein [Actinomycetota bacterium]|nr:glycosyltransferase family 4 protein [Actinomycetota bacterium]